MLATQRQRKQGEDAWAKAQSEGTLLTADMVEAEREADMAEQEAKRAEWAEEQETKKKARARFLALPIVQVKGLRHAPAKPEKIIAVPNWYERGPRFWVRLLSVIRVVLSGYVDPVTLRRREHSCGECPERIEDWASDGFTRASYCRACGCPQWMLSRLAYKNAKSAWQCPQRRWEGVEYGDEHLRDLLTEAGYGPDLERAKCGTCVGAK